MSASSDLDSIVLTIIQAVGLLLPVVLITVSELTPQTDKEWRRAWLFVLIVVMIISLSISGLFSTVGILRIGVRDWLAFLSILSLAVFFLSYAIFILVSLEPVSDYLHEEFMR